jgi:ABC-type transport system substrate-binding protein
MKRKSAIFALVILSGLLSMSAINSTVHVEGATAIANLVFKTNGGGTRPDYGLYIAQYVRDLGIEVEVKVEEWSVFVGTLLLTHDYDIGIVGLTGGGASPDMRSVYTTGGSLNLFLLDALMPYGNLSETMQDEGVTIVDLEARQQHYYDWQQLMMDKIVPMLPLYSPRSYVGVWSNTIGYEGRWGIVDSLPYMEYTGFHDGQVSLDEFNLADANWRELNPLFTDDTSSSFIWDLMAESILTFSPDFAPLKTGLVTDWEQIDEFHYKFTMRDDVYWNPSYDVRARTASSDPLSAIPTGELMVGLKDGVTYSDGTNVPVTAADVVFTYLAWSNAVISEDTTYHDWISGCYVDPADDYAFHIEIDGNPDTPAQEQYVDFWARLPWDVLPEFFLNSSDPTVTYTDGHIECTGLYAGMELTPQWVAFSTSAFGCGKYMLDYAVENSVTVLQANPNWFGVGAIDGTPQDLDIGTINIRVIPDTSAELAEFKAGKLDWTGLTAWPAERKQMQADPRFDVQTFVRGYILFMFYNLQRPFVGGADNYVYLDAAGKEEYTKGAAVRKAMNYAVDREEMNQVLHDGEYLICHSVLYPSTAYYYYNDIVKYNYDLWSAMDWLIAAGYPGEYPNTDPTTTDGTPFPVVGIIAAIGAAAAIVFYRKRK